MADNNGGNDKSGLLGVLIAVPTLAICCGAGGFLVAGAAGIFAALGGWLTGLGGVATALAVLGAVVLVHEIRRRRSAIGNGAPNETYQPAKTGATSGPAGNQNL